MRWLKLLVALLVFAGAPVTAQVVDTSLVGPWVALVPVVNLQSQVPGSMAAHITFDVSGRFESYLEITDRSDSTEPSTSAMPVVQGTWGTIEGPWSAPMLCVRKDMRIVGGVPESGIPHCQPFRLQNQKLIWNEIEFERYRETNTDL